MYRNKALTTGGVLFLATLCLTAEARPYYWGYPSAPYDYGMTPTPMYPRQRMAPLPPLPRAYGPDPARRPMERPRAPEPLPLSRLGRRLEQMGYEDVYAAEWEDYAWKLLTRRGRDLEVITLHPYTGRLLRRKPMAPRHTLPFSTVVEHLEKAGYGPISEMEFEDGGWEVEAIRNGKREEIFVERVSGRIQIRPDD